MERNRPDKQQVYRQKQANKGLVRFEIQVDAETKARFDEMVDSAADELAKPWDLRRRTAEARRQIFKEITQGVTHQFFMLKDEIGILKEEIKALSPQFFSTKSDTAPLPHAISSLPDDSDQLKKLLNQVYQEAQKAKSDLLEATRRAKQYLELYETLSEENDRLEKLVAEFNTDKD